MERVHTRLEHWCSTVWQELHTPLMALLSPLDELVRDPACVDIRSRLAPIQRNARRLLHLVDSLLLSAKQPDGGSPDEQQVELELPSDHTTPTPFSNTGHTTPLLAEQATVSSSGSSNEGDRAFLAKLDVLMCAELDNPAFDVRMICVRMRFSAKQMQRKIRMLTGLTPTEYLRQKRLRRAEEILLQGKSVSRAAYAAGFLSQSYFTTCFKTWAGETPRAWQKRMLRQPEVVTHKLPDR
jgi:AraC-like DNA-binding protein